MQTIHERIQNNIIIDAQTGCWEWQLRVDRDGYGLMWIGSKPSRLLRFSHRMSYEAHREIIPDGLQIDHLCRNKRCCNPSHLEVVTTQENTRRRDVALQRDHYCKRGHERTHDNTYVSPAGNRACKICRDGASQRWRTRQAA